MKKAMTRVPADRSRPRAGCGVRDDGGGAGDPALPAHAVRIHGGADDEGLHLQEARRAEAPRRGRSEHPDHPDGRRGAGDTLDLRWRDQHADARPRGEDGPFLQPLPLDRHVLAHACRPAHREEPHPGRQRTDLGDCQRLRRLQRDDPEVLGDRRGSAQGLRIQHRGLGQVAQHARRADHEQGTVRVLADRLRLRVLLRIPRGRGLAVRADPDPQHDAGHRASPQGLPPHRRHRIGRDHLAPGAEGLRAGQALLHVLGAGRVARPAPDHEGVGRQVQAASSTTAGTSTASASSRGPRRRVGSPRTPSSRRVPRPWRPGTRSPRPRSRSSAA